MALNFPSSPTNGQIYTDANTGQSYIYNSTYGFWQIRKFSIQSYDTQNNQILFSANGYVAGSNGIIYDPVSNTFYANTVNVTGYLYGNGAFLTGVVSDFSPAFNQANIAFAAANAAFAQANSVSSDADEKANAAIITANAAFDKANSANVLAYDTGIGANAYATTATIAANNYAGVMANAANAYTTTVQSIAIAAFVQANSVSSDADEKANAAIITANAAFDKANAANVLAYNTGIGANAYAATVGIYANVYADGVGSNANLYASGVGSNANLFAVLAFNKANSANLLAYNTGIGANLYADGIGSNANLFTSATIAGANIAVGTGANAFATSATIAANNYAGVMANAANAFMSSTVTGANVISSAAFDKANSANLLAFNTGIGANAYASGIGTNANSFASATIAGANAAVGSAANNYAGVMANAANAYMISTVSGANTIASNAYDKANSANVLAFNTGIGANAYASGVGSNANLFASATIAGANIAVGTGANTFATTATVAANNYAGVMANAVNAFVSATISGANTAVGAGANAFTSATIAGANTAVGAGANAFASATIAGANTAVGSGANSFATSATIAANNYAGVMANAANAFMTSTIAGANTAVGSGANAFTSATIAGANAAVGTGANAFTTSATIAANNYAGIMANAANAFANGKFLANTSDATFQGNLNVTANLTANTLVASAGYIDLGPGSRPANVEGRIYYDNIDKSLTVVNDSNFKLPVGQIEYAKVYNDSGSTLLKGKPVYATGFHTETHHHFTVDLADASDPAKFDVIGLVADDIPNASHGYVIVRGWIGGINTSSLTVGTRYHLGTSPGTLVTVSPEYPNYPYDIGYCIVANNTNGYLYVDRQSHTFERLRVLASTRIGGDLTVEGDFTVLGSQSIVTTNSLQVGTQYVYMGYGDSIPNSAVYFTGTGLNDIDFQGHYESNGNTTFYIVISDVSPDKFSWGYEASFANLVQSNVVIQYQTAQPLSNGISVYFNANTGHTKGDKWNATAFGVSADFGFVGNHIDGPNGYTHAGIFRDATDGTFKFFRSYDPEPNGNIDIANVTFALANLQVNRITAAEVYEGGSQISSAIANAYDAANGAFGKANSANVLAYNTGIGANAYASGVGSNANLYASATIAGANTAVGTGANTFATAATVAANNYAGVMANAANAFASATISGANTAVGSGANAFATAATVAANNYAGVMANAANAFMSSTLSGTNAIATAAFSRANASVNVINIGGTITLTSNSTQINVVSSNGVSLVANNFAGIATLNIGLTTTGVTATTYGATDTIIPRITVDSYGRITSAANITVANATLVAISSNNYAGQMANAANAFMSSTVAGANAAVGSAANNYAGVMANAANAFMISVQNGSNTAVGAGANTVGSAAFAKANGAVQTGYTTVAVGGQNLVPSSNADTLTIANSNGISIVSVTGASDSFNIGLTLTGVVSSVYGSATIVPVITVDAYGRITSVSNVAISATGGGGSSVGYFQGNNGNTGNLTAGTGDIFRTHSNTLTQNVTIVTGNNAVAVGPLTVATNRTLTIQTGARVSIV